MPGDSVDVLVDFGIIEFTESAAPQIVVVIQNPDFRREAVL